MKDASPAPSPVLTALIADLNDIAASGAADHAWTVSTVLDWLKDHIALLERDLSTYPAYRDGYLAIQFWLNRQGLIAPAFRPVVRMKGFRLGSDKELKPALQAVGNDRQAIDLDWLRTNAIEVVHDDYLLSSWESDAVAAAVKKEYTAASKARILALIPDVQFELISIMSDTVRDTQRELRWQAEQIRKRLAQKIQRDRRYGAIENLDRITFVWLASQIAGCCIGGKAQPADVQKWYVKVTGHALTKTQLRNALGQVRRYIEGGGDLPALEFPRLKGPTFDERMRRAERAGPHADIEGSMVKAPIAAPATDRSSISAPPICGSTPTGPAFVDKATAPLEAASEPGTTESWKAIMDRIHREDLMRPPGEVFDLEKALADLK